MNRITVEFNDQTEGLGADDFEAANNFFSGLEQRFNGWMTPFDVILSPVMHAPPPRLGLLGDDSKGYTDMSRRVFDSVGYITPPNVFGLPGMSLSLTWTMDGLPIASHFFAKDGQEPMLLKLTYELKAARLWKDKWAPNSIAII